MTTESKVKPKKARSGQYWHVKMPGATTLVTKYVKEATRLTIELADQPYTQAERYKLSDVELVERRI